MTKKTFKLIKKTNGKTLKRIEEKVELYERWSRVSIVIIYIENNTEKSLMRYSGKYGNRGAMMEWF